MAAAVALSALLRSSCTPCPSPRVSSTAQAEEEYVKKICDEIIAFKPDVVVTEKGLSELACHHFVKANITALRRMRKTDNNRIGRAVGATIVGRTDEIREEDIGTKCGLFEIVQVRAAMSRPSSSLMMLFMS
jgi:chaperonin GroEL (HSP60 family)